MKFISIFQLLDAFSRRIDLPGNWDSLIAIPETDPSLSFFKGERLQALVSLNYSVERSLALNFFVRAYKQSVAARGLDMVLVNHAEICPAWYDIKDTGAPKKNSEAASIVGPILVHLANSFDYLLDFHRRNGFDHRNPSAPKGYAQPEDAKRLDEIGFFYEDLQIFFKAIDIDDPFEEPVDESAVISDASTCQSLGKTINRLPDQTSRKHPLYELINQAKASAADPLDYKEVWLKLIEIALSGKPPLPMMYYEEGKGIKYIAGDGMKHYTEGALRQYFSRLAKKC
ncbi:hypothetical protein [Chromobacterium sp. ATCC 53434]|uniref:hypothetical protein n=1 Tax=Chromobacterium sp. (strain ATCC 53434 / SC 14030) TaxID=2059672 RepID=UPI0013050731|nr:hypothetical protein [Chromobacterium sp. ATCC 53434]